LRNAVIGLTILAEVGCALAVYQTRSLWLVVGIPACALTGFGLAAYITSLQDRRER
jgi:hypothetical protein